MDTAKTSICIDHHITNQGYAAANFVKADASATCELLYDFLDEEKISRDVAECIYTGILHDTNVFKNSNMILTCFGLFGISWYATRQRIREISIRKIHGATSRQIVLLLNKPFCLQILLAYILAVPIVYWLMHHWHEQFAYKAPFTVMDFLLPLCIVWIISAVTVCLQSYLLNKTNPIDCIKSE